MCLGLKKVARNGAILIISTSCAFLIQVFGHETHRIHFHFSMIWGFLAIFVRMKHTGCAYEHSFAKFFLCMSLVHWFTYFLVVLMIKSKPLLKNLKMLKLEVFPQNLVSGHPHQVYRPCQVSWVKVRFILLGLVCILLALRAKTKQTKPNKINLTLTQLT